MKLKLTELTEKITPLPWPEDLDSDDAPYFESKNPSNLNYKYARHAANTLPKLVEALEQAENMYATSKLLANDLSCGKWINELRQTLTLAREVEI